GHAAAEVEGRESVAGDDVAVERRIVEPLGQLVDEAGINFLPDRPDNELTERHMEPGTLTKRSLPVKLAGILLGSSFFVVAAGAGTGAAGGTEEDPREAPAPSASPAPPGPLAGAIDRSAVDERALRATVEELAACGTRHSLSSWEDPARGAGCGRDRVRARL